MQEPLATDMDIKDEILTDDGERSGVYLTKNGRVRKDRTTNYVYGSGPGSKKVQKDMRTLELFLELLYMVT